MSKITFVLPVHNEEEGIALFHDELVATLESRPEDHYNLIYVDDGSVDRSFEIMSDFVRRDPRVRVISLSRNFGHQAAITAGLDAADGDAVIIMDTDLQDPPEVALELIDRWREGFDVVYARRRLRQEGWFKRATASIFYWLLSKFSEIDIPRNVGDFRLADRRVVREIRRFREHDRFVRGMFAFVGFRQGFVDFDRPARAAGDSSYPFVRMLKLAADGVLGFSSAPLRMVRNVGFLIASLALIGITWILVGKITSPDSVVPGWTFIVISVLFVGGVQVTMLAIVGAYVGRIHSEAKGRPLYVVMEDSAADDQEGPGPEREWGTSGSSGAQRSGTSGVRLSAT